MIPGRKTLREKVVDGKCIFFIFAKIQIFLQKQPKFKKINIILTPNKEGINDVFRQKHCHFHLMLIVFMYKKRYRQGIVKGKETNHPLSGTGYWSRKELW